MIYLKPRRAAGKSTGSNLALTLSLCKQRIQPRGRLFLYAGQHMGIPIHRQRDRRVPKPLLYDLRVLERKPRREALEGFTFQRWAWVDSNYRPHAYQI